MDVSWTIKKAEHRRIDAFELWYWRKLLRVPWTAKRSNLSILKEISPKYSLQDWCWSWNSNTLATWCKELTTHWKRFWCWERLKVGGWDGWMASPTRWTWLWVSSRSLWWTGKPGVQQSMGSQIVEHDWATKPNTMTKYQGLWGMHKMSYGHFGQDQWSCKYQELFGMGQTFYGPCVLWTRKS